MLASTVRLISGVNAVTALVALIACGIQPAPTAPAPALPVLADGERRAEALVLIDSRSPHSDDFTRLVQPYLQHFGLPARVIDLRSAALPARLEGYALLVIGHRGVAAAGGLDDQGQAAIASAVAAGIGLVIFDNDVWAGDTLRYPVLRSLQPRRRVDPPTEDVTFAPPSDVTIATVHGEGSAGTAFATAADAAAVVADDGRWTAVQSPGAAASIMAGLDEAERHGLPPLRFTAEVRAGTYHVLGTVYTGPPGWDVRYHYGFRGEGARARHVDVGGGSGGRREHTEVLLGEVTVPDGRFELRVQDADLLRGTSPGFGWARVRLVRPDQPARLHFVRERHPAWDLVPTEPMTMADIALPDDRMVVAFNGAQPLLMLGTSGTGRLVQWGSYDWMRPGVRGPLGGLDDLLWRSLVWAARKPFVMQVLPPVLTMRMDDESGPLDWLHAAIAVGFRPWVGVFLSHIDDTEARELGVLARAGTASVSVHSFDDTTFFYFDHQGRRDWPAATMADNLRQADAWHRRYDIPPSSYVVPHYYEIGENALPGLVARGARFVATHMTPGQPYGAPWLAAGPYRRGTNGPSMAPLAVAYNDVLDRGPSAIGGRLHACVTEIRDEGGYEWYPTPQVSVTTDRGLRQLRRALDSRVIATLFTHGYFVPPIGASRWQTILQTIVAGVDHYAPRQMTMDDACALARGQFTSSIAAATVAATGARIDVELDGHAEVATSISIFTDRGAGVEESLAWLPPFTDRLRTSVAAATAAGR
jgi:hypothetical protein